MSTLKWKTATTWETFYQSAFDNIKNHLNNIILAINNMAKAVRMRARIDKNLSDLYNKAAARTNLQLINDCSALAQAPHHHDSRYIPKINAEAAARKSEDDALWAAIGDTQQELASQELPIGTILAFGGNTSDIPSNWHLCDGTDGTPDLRNLFLMGWGDHPVGQPIEAGLPNIKGSSPPGPGRNGGGGFYCGQVHIEGGTGPFKKQNNRGWAGSAMLDAGEPAWSLTSWLDFDASLANKIYGKSTTVQPPAYAIYYIIKIS